VLKRWRRRRVLARHSIPDELWRGLLAATPVLAQRPSEELARLRELVLLFLHEKHLEAAGGLALDDAMRLKIAALACLPILNLGLDAYANFAAVIVYPDPFVIRDRTYEDEDGVVHTGDDVLSGEAWEQGPVILAWSEVAGSGLGEAFNVVVHEFAHKLDMLNGEADGVPPLHAGMRLVEWTAAFDGAYDDLVAQLERGREPWLDPYAAEDPAELFAVCSELFFDVPDELKAEYPEVYVQLAAFFRQDPAAYVSASLGG
jgi:Mlc titration factor MtfA (ptsG expression regulator)